MWLRFGLTYACFMITLHYIELFSVWSVGLESSTQQRYRSPWPEATKHSALSLRSTKSKAFRYHPQDRYSSSFFTLDFTISYVPYLSCYITYAVTLSPITLWRSKSWALLQYTDTLFHSRGQLCYEGAVTFWKSCVTLQIFILRQSCYKDAALFKVLWCIRQWLVGTIVCGTKERTLTCIF